MYPRKSLGQHFLIAPDIARRMVEALAHPKESGVLRTGTNRQGRVSPIAKGESRQGRKAEGEEPSVVLEVGPGKGAVTRFLVERFTNVYAVELDKRMCEFIESEFPQLRGRIFNEDFLELDLDRVAPYFQLIGSFPYNISSQIIFRAIEHRERIPVVVGMFQREVAKRIVATHGNKDYGILSVLTQTFYDSELLFNVKAGSFSPPPKVMSAVIRLRLKPKIRLKDESFFFKVVKAAFNQRRKMLRNSLSQFLDAGSHRSDILRMSPSARHVQNPELERFLTKRPEQVSVKEFQELAELLNGT